ncbi:MAG: hypothetical protein WCF22_14250 [Candidatus Sulfotelmatobacter sp.]
MHSEPLNRWSLGAQRWGVVLLAFNFIGAVVYIYLASHAWATAESGEVNICGY